MSARGSAEPIGADRMSFKSLTLHQLEIFAAIHDHGSFHKAAQALLLSEPSISQQVKLLERAVGARLFDRGPRRPVRLTAAGGLLLNASNELFELLRRVAEELDALRRAEAGTVRFGAHPYFCGQFLPALYASFRERSPNVIVRGVEGARDPLLDDLEARRLDLVVVPGAVSRPGLQSAELARGDSVLIGPPGHPLAVGPPAAFSALAAQEIILREPPSGSTAMLEQRAAESGISLKFGWRASTIDAEVNAALNGLGVAVVPFATVSTYLDQGLLSLLQVEGFPVRWTAFVVWPSQVGPPVQAFVDHLLEHRREIEAANMCPAIEGAARPQLEVAR